MRNKIEKTHAKERKKKSHVQDSIYGVQQFAYIHRVARISLLSGKNIKCGSTVFLSLKNYILKNPKNHATLFGSGLIVNRIKYN